MKLAIENLSGGRVSNAWVTCPMVRDNIPKGMLRPDMLTARHRAGRKGSAIGWTRVPLASW
jgi:hypothetical protein